MRCMNKVCRGLTFTAEVFDTKEGLLIVLTCGQCGTIHSIRKDIAGEGEHIRVTIPS